MQVPAGLLSDSWGSRKTITVFFMIAFIGSVLLGLAPSAFWAILGRTLVGLGISMLFVPTLKVLAEWFKVREFATMTGILMAMGGIGTLTAATPMALLSNWMGWRLSFVVVGGITLVLSILVWFFVRDRPTDMGLPAVSGSLESENDGPEFGLLAGMKTVLSYPRFWPVAIWFFFNCGFFFTFGGLWGGPYLMHVYGFTKSQTGHILSMLAVGMIVGSPLVSFLSNRIFKGRKPILILSSFINLSLTALFAFYTDKLTPEGLYIICFGLGIFSSAIVVIAFTTSKELFPLQIAGTSTGLANIFPFAGGAVFQPVFGYILERHGRVGDAFALAGYEQGFFMLFICGIIALLASLCLQETLAKE
jgi:sugar phosphate permease